jgi:hypothetical protein
MGWADRRRFYKKDDETVFVLGMKFAEARLKEKNT